MRKSRYTTIDLFAGVGGIRLGFDSAGFETVFANDYEEKCKETYDSNFNEPGLTIEDIREISPRALPDFDVLLGGFPCQPFSVAGYKKGFKDRRGDLFFEIVRILKSKKPTCFLLENVRNMYTHNKGKTFERICDLLDEVGYSIQYKIMNTAEYGGVPQNRERIYIVGFTKESGLVDTFSFPNKLPLKRKVRDLLQKSSEIGEQYRYCDKPLAKRIHKNDLKSGIIYQWRRKYLRENKSGLCPTLTANTGMGGHNVPIVKDRIGIRKLTPRECARFQGFPESYTLPDLADSHLYKQIGNSVSVPVVRRIANQMYKVLQR